MISEYKPNRTEREPFAFAMIREERPGMKNTSQLGRRAKLIQIDSRTSEDKKARLIGKAVSTTTTKRKEAMQMKVITLKPFQSTYKNRGQAAEQAFRYTLTGEIQKADNRKGAPDIDNIQVKTDRATLAINQELQSYINGNTAEIFAYVTRDLTKAYIMSKLEFLNFASSFITYDYDSQTKQGKTRLKTEGNRMRAYLERNAKRA